MVQRVSPLEVYKALPKKNCGQCGLPTCIAFAAELIEGKLQLKSCPLLTSEQRQTIERLTAPPVKEVVIGVRRRVVVGGERVLHRHELKFFNPTALAVDISDRCDDESLKTRVRAIVESQIERTGQRMNIDLIAVLASSNSQKRFREATSIIHERSELPLILCSSNPKVLEAGLEIVGDENPLLYAATSDTLNDLIDLSKKFSCPLTVSSKKVNELGLMAEKATNKGIDVVLDPHSCSATGISKTLLNFVTIRRAAIEYKRPEFGHPIIGIPAVAWREFGDASEAFWRELLLASMLMSRYADILILHSIEISSILPIFTLRQGIYSDPRAPSFVKPGLYRFGNPNEISPVLMTTNYALTFYIVSGDIEKSKADCYLLVLDTQGMSVLNALAGRQLTPKSVADLIKTTGVESELSHKKLIIPGLAAKLRGEIEDVTGWEVIVGPIESADIPAFLKKLVLGG